MNFIVSRVDVALTSGVSLSLPGENLSYKKGKEAVREISIDGSVGKCLG